MNDETAKKMIERHEGRKKRIYRDSLGNLSCGVGHLLEEGSEFPRSAADILFERDFMVACADVAYLTLQNQLNLTSNRRAVLIDMVFNLGLSRIQTFKRMFAALREDNFELAADEMLDSRWAGQVKGRAIELSDMMRAG